MSATPFLTEPFAPIWRPRTYAAALYVLLAFPIGLTAFLLLVVGGAVGVGLSIVWVGIPILVGLLAASRAFAAFDRGLANRLLGTGIPAPAAQRSRGGSVWSQVKSLVSSGTTWRSILWLTLRFPLGLAAFVAIVTIAGAGLALIIAPFTDAFVDAYRPIDISGASEALCVVGGLALLLLSAHVSDGFAWVHGALARGLLGPSRGEEIAALAARSERADARADLARELHDSVGHSVTAAVLQASAARRVLHTDPAFVDEALSAIEAQGRDALEELDRVLAVLRNEAGETRPAPTLADVDALLARTRAAGVSLAITRSGDLERVPAAVGREAYRVLQEALTNVMRHATGADATVSLAVGEHSLSLAVENGPGAALAPGRGSGGNGLRGVRERLRALGGSLTTSETPGGGYALHAELPLRQDPERP
jgi:signal transduction histidine kinase